jgi:hypothetical protein
MGVFAEALAMLIEKSGAKWVGIAPGARHEGS